MAGKSKVEYGPFAGDGRTKIYPHYTALFAWTKPVAVTYGTARILINNFIETGRSAHSGAGATLWVLLWWCASVRQPYRLTAHPGEGYYIEVVAPIP